jgi:phosphoglycolate phosphatase-like HAD superfamily hydrolase
VLKTSNGEVLPGVFELLTKLNEMPTVALGILTGNASEAAAIKLEHFQLSEYFLFGGYGDDHHDRNDVAAQAVTAASKSLGSRFDPSKVWVIGDTSNDIRCARSIGAKVFAVTTGGESLEQLSESNPDFLKDDLNDVNEWLSNLH